MLSLSVLGLSRVGAARWPSRAAQYHFHVVGFGWVFLAVSVAGSPSHVLGLAS